MSNLFKSLSWYGSSKLISIVISFLSIPIFARILDPSEYGMVAIYISTLAIASPLLSFALSFSITRAKVDFEKYFKNYTVSIIIFVLFSWVTFFSLSLILGFDSLIATGIGISEFMVFVLIIDILLKTIIDILCEYNRAEFRYKFISIFLTNLQLFAFIISFLAIEYFELPISSAEDRVVGLFSANLMFTLIILIKFFHDNSRVELNQFRVHVKYGLLFSIPIIFASIGHVINAQADRIIIGYLLDTTAVGIYSLSYSIGSLLFVFSGTIHQAISPWVYQNYKSGNIERVSFFFKSYTFLSVVLISMLLLMSGDIVELIAGRDYSESNRVIPWIFISGFFQILITIESTIQMYNKNTGSYSRIVCAGAIINIILNFVLIPPFGVEAAAITTLVTYIIMFIFLLYSNKLKRYKEKSVSFQVYTLSVVIVLLVFLLSISISRVHSYYAVTLIFSTVTFALFLKYKKIKRLYSCL